MYDPEEIPTTVELAKIPELAGIELAVAQPIIDAFLPHFQEAQKILERTAEINVTDPTDVDDEPIAFARVICVAETA